MGDIRSGSYYVDVPSPARARLLGAVALIATACADAPLTLPLDARAGDVVVLAYRKDGQPQIGLRPFEPGRPFEVDADRDQPVYTFLLEAGAFLRPDGRPLSAEQLAAVQLRTDRAPAGPDDCGRCLAPVDVAPMTVPAGSACAVPDFAPRAEWRAADGDRADCAGGPRGRLCATGGDAALARLEAIRGQLVLVWPGACACRPADAPSLAGLDIRAVGPPQAPWPIETWAMSPDGSIGGFRRELAVRYDPATGALQTTRVEGIDATVEISAGLRDGSFLVAAAGFNNGLSPPYELYRFRPAPEGGFAAPQRVAPTVPVRPSEMRYLEPEGPLYLIGKELRSLSLEPAIYACDDNFACTPASVGRCPRGGALLDTDEARVLDNGIAIARALKALYLRPAGAGPTGDWTCRQPSVFDWLDPARSDPPPRLDEYQALGVAGNRAFLCARTQASGCDDKAAMVLTAELAGPDPSRAEWRVAYAGPPGAECRAVIERGSAGVRVVLSNLRAVDLDRSGAVIGEASLDETYGPMPGRSDVLDLGGGRTMHVGDGNRAFLDRGRGLERVYGPAALPSARFEAGVALPDGRFAALGARGVWLVDEADRVVEVPFTGAWFPVTAAALDPASPPGGPWRLLVGGPDGQLGAATVTEAEAELAPLPAPTGPVRPIRGIAAVGDGRFVVAGPATQLLRVEGAQVSPIPVTWDDPSTDRVEAEPTHRDECTPPSAPADVFRGISGGDGIAWVVGLGGLVLRVLPDRADRFAIDAQVDATGVDAVCPDLPRVVGQRSTIDGSGLVTLRLRAFALQADDPARRPALRSIGEDDILAIPELDIRAGRPVSILRDGAWSGQRTGFAFVNQDGFLHRMFSGAAPAYVRVPFWPVMVVRNPDGSALFGAHYGRLAVGRRPGP